MEKVKAGGAGHPTREPSDDEGGYPPQPYGDLTALNTSRLILEAVGRASLERIVRDFLDVLGTSAAVYERNGDYALGIFSSGWCKLLDCASRQRCATPDNGVALRDPAWLCHQSCWEASRMSMAQRGAVDMQCEGGMRLYAMPIIARGEVVGSINFGYGRTPREQYPLIAERFGVSESDLLAASPGHVLQDERVDIVKRWLRASADHIGVIVERWQAEQELREQKEKAELYLDVAGVMMIGLDSQGRITLANRKALDVLGYQRDEFLGSDWFSKCLPELSREATRTAFHQLVAGDIEAIGRHENPVRTSDGRQRLIAWHNALVPDATGRIVGTLSSGEDVTELREGEGLFRAIFDQAAVGVAQIQSRTGRFLRINQRYCDIVGQSREAMLSKTFQEITHPDDLQRDLDNLHALLAGEIREYSMEKRYFTRQGSEVWVKLTVSPMWRPGEDPESHVAVVEDITEHKRVEVERERLEDRMRAAQKLESLGILAGGIAHDFNNILVAIMGNIDLARTSSPPGTQKHEFLDRAQDAATRASHLCRQMLAYSGRGTLKVAPIDLSGLVRELGSMLDVSISKKALLRYELSSEPLSVLGDSAQLTQLVLNLITNASDAMRDQPGSILLRTEQGMWPSGSTHAVIEPAEVLGRCAVLEVADSGCGMDEATMGKMFDPFFTTKFTGRGLGLAAVSGIIRGHRGGLEVQTAPGQGSSMRVYLPVTQQTEQEQSRKKAMNTPPRRAKILLVDDEPLVRAVAVTALQQAGFDVLEACDGREAVRLFQEQLESIRCVFLDLTMPEMDGTEAFHAIRLLSSDIPVVMMSGYPADGAAAELQQEGLSGFLVKPFRPAELVELARQMLSE